MSSVSDLDESAIVVSSSALSNGTSWVLTSTPGTAVFIFEAQNSSAGYRWLIICTGPAARARGNPAPNTVAAAAPCRTERRTNDLGRSACIVSPCPRFACGCGIKSARPRLCQSRPRCAWGRGRYCDGSGWRGLLHGRGRELDAGRGGRGGAGRRALGGGGAGAAAGALPGRRRVVLHRRRLHPCL